MAKLQKIKRKNGSTTCFVYLPKAELEKAGFKQEEELLIEARHGCILIHNSLNKTTLNPRKDKNSEHEIRQTSNILALDNSKVSEEFRNFREPVEAQKQIAVQIKIFLDQQIKREMREKGFLSDHTRRWVAELVDILDKIQKALHGEKSVNLHLHKKVSHADIAAKMRTVIKKKEEEEE